MKQLFLKLVMTVLLMLLSSEVWPDEIYYCCSYENDTWGTNILVTKIDLDAKSIVDSVSVPLEGELQQKEPIFFLNRGILFVSSINGLPAKNSEVQDSFYTNFALLNRNLHIIRIGQIPKLHLFGISKFAVSDSAMIKFDGDYLAANGRMNGILKINNMDMPEIEPRNQDIFNDQDFPTIAGFKYFKKIKPTNDRLYWCTTSEGIYLLSLDVNQNRLIDSLNVETSTPYFYQFGLSDDDSLVYVFFMNSNYLGHPESMQKLNIDSSYVKILSARDFSLIDSVSIEYPPLDSGYVMGTNGPIDKVGPYFVYFDLAGEDYRYFSPAMLFIFDTRTNEASWLRVGWR